MNTFIFRFKIKLNLNHSCSNTLQVKTTVQTEDPPHFLEKPNKLVGYSKGHSSEIPTNVQDRAIHNEKSFEVRPIWG